MNYMNCHLLHTIIVNVCDILYVIFRRGLRAVSMLIPLFGLQLFFTIYRLPVGSTGERAYEYITFVITSLQVK